MDGPASSAINSILAASMLSYCFGSLRCRWLARTRTPRAFGVLPQPRLCRTHSQLGRCILHALATGGILLLTKVPTRPAPRARQTSVLMRRYAHCTPDSTALEWDYLHDNYL